MATSFAKVTANPSLSIDIEASHGWRRRDAKGVSVWIAGHVHEHDDGAVIDMLASKHNLPGENDLAAWLRGLTGHFAIVAQGTGWTFAAVDPVRSIPLFFGSDHDGWRIDNEANRLRIRLGLGPNDIDTDAALAMGMAGYTIGTATLYRGLRQLGPGELLRHQTGFVEPIVRRYYVYRPWRVQARSDAAWRRELADVTLGLFEKLAKSTAGRPLAVPLSAGVDSRLVASALHHIGFRDVRCFAYGIPGNRDARISQRVAERLGFDWTFVPTTIGNQRRYFDSDLHRGYLAYADSCASVPFEMDLWPIRSLVERGYIPTDAVIANGNSGDYISGAHIVPEIQAPRPDLPEEDRMARILDALVHKHFRLWRSLATPANDERVKSLLKRMLSEAGAEFGDPETDHGIYEYAEFQDRQCKYVITGQRIYEFLGHDWRLPLWDADYLRFWEGVPLRLKVEQRLYRDVVEERNWGGVWQDIPINPLSIHPRWIAAPRLAAKIAHAPLGAERWHAFERRVFQYWMDTIGSFACVPYRRVVCDRRGHRNSVSWLVELYLGKKGLALDSLLRQAAA